MARRPRPTLRELDSLQRRYDAVVATMHRVVGERDAAADEMRWKEAVASNIIAGLRSDDDRLSSRVRVLDGTWWDRLWISRGRQ